jgi:hypothetical protein
LAWALVPDERPEERRWPLAGALGWWGEMGRRWGSGGSPLPGWQGAPDGAVAVSPQRGGAAGAWRGRPRAPPVGGGEGPRAGPPVAREAPGDDSDRLREAVGRGVGPRPPPPGPARLVPVRLGSSPQGGRRAARGLC